MTLAGKAALVTGGSRGMGAAIARRLAAEGADVAITYLASAERAEAVAAEIAATGRKARAIRADNRDAGQVERAVAEAHEAFGRLDILVNNAGIFHAAPVDELSVEDFDATIGVNLRAAFVAAKAAAERMGEGGRIISIGSNLAVRAPGPGLSLYTASKAGLVGLSQALARDLGARGITVNVVNPGSTDTDMNPAEGEYAADQLALMAQPRFADAAEIADVVAFLASDAARSVTGAAWTIDNGANA